MTIRHDYFRSYTNMIEKKLYKCFRYYMIEILRYLLNKCQKYDQEREFILKNLTNLTNIIKLSLLLIIKKELKNIIKYL